MIKKIFFQKIDSITIAAILVAGSSLVSRLLGVFRDRVLAGKFGAGDSLDIYYAAFRLPDLIFNLIVLGALSAGFIPIFTSLINKKENDKNIEAWKLTNYVINTLLLVIVFLSVFVYIFAYHLVPLITPGFNQDKLSQTVLLTRIMLISPIFLALSGVLGGVLQSFKRFLIYSLAPLFYNFGIIIGALLLVEYFDLVGLAWGVVLGAFLHFLIQLPAVWQLGWRPSLGLGFRNFNVKKIWSMMTARVLTLAINQVNFLVTTIISSSLVAGSLAVYNLANNLQSFPIGIFGISFAIAAFPTISAQAFNRELLIKNYSRVMRHILFFMIPATVFFILLRAQIIRVILGSGQFNWEDTIRTFNTLGMFAVSFFAQATIPFLTRIYYARQNSLKPFYFGLIGVVVNIVLAYWLAPKMEVAGLALAFSLSSILQFVLLFIFLHFELGPMDDRQLFNSLIKFCVAASLAGLMIQLTKQFSGQFLNLSFFVGIFSQALLASLAGLVVYIGSLFLLKSSEVEELYAAIRQRFFTKVKIGTDSRDEARGI